jgi:hypothetical protein
MMPADPFDIGNSDAAGDAAASQSGSIFDSPSFYRNLTAFGASTMAAANARTPQGFLQYGTGIAGPVGAGMLGAMEQSRQNAELQSKIGLQGAQTATLKQGMAKSQIETEFLKNRLNLMQNLPSLDSGLSAPQGQQPNQSQPASSASPSSLTGGIQGIESGGNYAAQNKGGYSGAYQFGTAALQDAGMYQPAQGEDIKQNQWKGQITVPGFQPMTQQQFLASPQAQDAAFNVSAKHNMDLAQQTGMTNYIGQTVGGVPITPATLVAGMHFGGREGTARFLATGGNYNPADVNGTKLSDYMLRVAGAHQQIQGQQQTQAGGGAASPQQMAEAGRYPASVANDAKFPGASPQAPVQSSPGAAPQQQPASQQQSQSFVPQGMPSPQQALAEADRLDALTSRYRNAGLPQEAYEARSKALREYALGALKNQEVRSGGLSFSPATGWTRNPSTIQTVDAAGNQHPMFVTPPLPGSANALPPGGGISPIQAPGAQGAAPIPGAPSGEATTKLGPVQQETLAARGKISQGDMNQDRKLVEETLAATLDHQQPAQQQLLLLRNLAADPNTASGAAGELRSSVKNYFQTFAPKFASDLLGVDAAPSQEFMKVALMSAGKQEQETLGSRGGFRALELYQNANPNIGLQPDANRQMANALLVSHQRGVDYTQGATDFYHVNHDQYQAGTGPYNPVSKFDAQFMQAYKPEMYFSAIQAINGKPFSEWAHGLTPQQGKIVAGIVQRADPTAQIYIQDKLIPVSQLDRVSQPSELTGR